MLNSQPERLPSLHTPACLVHHSRTHQYQVVASSRMPASWSNLRLASVLLVLLLLPAVLAFDCRIDLPSSKSKGKDVHFDLGPLDGEHSASKTTQTPPTTNEAKVRLVLCGDEGLKRDSDVADEDQVCFELPGLRIKGYS